MNKILWDPIKPRQYFESQAMYDWLTRDLPMFFSYWYVPQHGDSNNDSYLEIKKYLANDAVERERELNNKCNENMELIIASMDEKLREFFKLKAGETREEKKLLSGIHLKYCNELMKICQLHTHMNHELSPDNPTRGT